MCIRLLGLEIDMGHHGDLNQDLIQFEIGGTRWTCTSEVTISSTNGFDGFLFLSAIPNHQSVPVQHYQILKLCLETVSTMNYV